MRKMASILPALFLAAALLTSLPVPAKAAGEEHKRFIAIVYDDSGSMRYDTKNRDVYKNYIYANYSLQNLAALMEKGDEAKVYLFSKKGEKPIDISRQPDLFLAMKDIGSKPLGNTYAETVYRAMGDGAEFLKGNKDAEFLLVMITDGDRLENGQGQKIQSSLKDIFIGYLQKSDLISYQGRASALLLSIGRQPEPLPPVSDLASVLDASGIHAEVFKANVSNAAEAETQIISAMTNLAKAMASTNSMQVASGKAFTVRYPLESLVIMEQSNGSLITGIKDSHGVSLDKSLLYTTKAIKGVKLASTFSSVKAQSGGSIKPGTYQLTTSGKATLVAFSKIGFTTFVSLKDKNEQEVAAYNGNKWVTKGISLLPGDKLSCRISFVAMDGKDVVVDSHVKIDIGSPECFTCTPGEKGTFSLEAAKAGQGYLEIGLNDPDFFQIAVPPLAVTVNELGTVQPSPSMTNESAQPSPSSPAVPDKQSVLDRIDLAAISGRMISVGYTSSNDYENVAEYPIIGPGEKSQLQVSVEPAPPPGLQIRFNDTIFDAGMPSGTVQAGAANTISVWADSVFTAAGKQALQMKFDDGSSVTLNIEPKPRRVKVEISTGSLAFGVLDDPSIIPRTAYTVWIEQGGVWREAGPSEVTAVQVAGAGGFAQRIDTKTRTVSLHPAWPAIFTPAGESTVLLRAGTGKPGETAEVSLTVTVRDDWRRWLYFSVGFLIIAFAAFYTAAIALKKRIPMELDVFKGTNPDMSDSIKVELVRRMLRRNLWPFGRETATIGPLELYPDPKDKKRIVLSSVCVQLGLTLDGKPPQYHKVRDKAGDFVLNGDTVVGIREDGSYRYYMFKYHGLKMGTIRKIQARHVLRR